MNNQDAELVRALRSIVEALAYMQRFSSPPTEQQVAKINDAVEALASMLRP